MLCWNVKDLDFSFYMLYSNRRVAPYIEAYAPSIYIFILVCTFCIYFDVKVILNILMYFDSTINGVVVLSVRNESTFTTNLYLRLHPDMIELKQNYLICMFIFILKSLLDKMLISLMKLVMSVRMLQQVYLNLFVYYSILFLFLFVRELYLTLHFFSC